jgi:chromosome partitioning protein
MEFPMRRIAIINQKGGVGKTTTAVNLSAALAELGNRVCLIDMDPQAHASLHLGVTLASDQKSVYDCLTDDAKLEDVRVQVDEHLYVVPAHIDLAAAEMELAGEVGREIILRDLIENDTEDFEFVIIDCPPSLGVLTLNALTTAGEVFLPMQPHFLALHGLSKLLRTIEIVARRLNPVLTLSGIVFCMFDGGTRLAHEVTSDINAFFDNERKVKGTWPEAFSFDTRIRRNVRLAEAPSFGQSIFQYASSSNGAQDYQSLAMEVLEQSTLIPQSMEEESSEIVAKPIALR